MLRLWTASPLGDMASGCGYMLRLTREGTAIMDGERGSNPKLRLALRLVEAEKQLDRVCVVHPWATAAELRKCGTVGVSTAKLLTKAHVLQLSARGL